MFSNSFLLGSITVTSLALATAQAMGGTDILHFFDRATFTDNGVATTASGSVNARENKQGKADNESVRLSFKGLNAYTAYTLLISTVNDTNLTSVSDLTADARGRAKLNFRKLGNGNGLGHGDTPLPDAMDPVSELRTFAVADTNAQAVLTADLTAPNHLQYLIKRDLSTTDIIATLRIHANTETTRLRLSARGLPATNEFFLVLNGGVVQTNSTDARGRLEIGTALLNPTDILDLRSVVLSDTASTVVLSTTLP